MDKYDKEKIKSFPIKVLIERETGRQFVRKGATEFTNCPMHDDPGPSLSIDEKSNEWYCHGACGVGGDTIKFIELTRNLDFQEACKYIADKYEPSAYNKNTAKAKGNAKLGRKPPPQMPIPEGAIKNALEKALKTEWWVEEYGKLSGSWKYHDNYGGVTYLDIRFEKLVEGAVKKQVVPLYYSKSGKWKMGIPFDREGRKRILYNLHMLAATKDKPVLLVEGCKCASVSFPGLHDAFVLTTWPGGVNGVGKVDMRPLFGRRVYIWPDNDKPDNKWERAGYKASYFLAAALEGKADVTIIKAAEHPSGKPGGKGYDIADYIEDGGDPIAYVNNTENHLSLDDIRELAGFKMHEKKEDADFRDARKFTTLKEPDYETMHSVKNILRSNKTGNIIRDDGNFLIILEADPAFRYLVAYDRATNDIKFSDTYTELDELENYLWQYTQRYYDIAPTKSQRSDIIKTIAYKNSYNSLEIFLDSLEDELFNGEPLEFPANPLHEILGFMRFSLEEEYTDDTEIKKLYTELFDKFFMRMFIKLEYIIKGELDRIPPADIVPILEGDQGIGKTRICLLLSIEPTSYYVDMAELQLTSSRDTLAKIRGKFIGELGELAGLKRTELESIKAFISSTFDEMRRLYSENTVRSPRTVSFIGTTNEREYLRDTTGNRRFWPVRLDYVDHNLFSEKMIIKKLYVYYRQKARESIKADTVYEDLFVSEELTEFVQYLREEKRVVPVFIDTIIKYIEDKEDAAYQGDPVKINITHAASELFKLSEEQLVKLPPRFAPEFIRTLERRGYKKKRGVFNGRQRRYWQLKGRYCTGCRNIVESVCKVTFDDNVKRLCDDCLRANADAIPEPF